MSIHLPWLIAVFTHRGGRFRNPTAASLDDPALRGFDLVINCAGLAAGALAGDREVHPIKGQTLVLKPRSQPLELERYVVMTTIRRGRSISSPALPTSSSAVQQIRTPMT